MGALEDGIAAIKAGKIDDGRMFLAEAIKENKDSERAWGWMYNACKTDQERISCLNQILRINPQNKKANELLINLTKEHEQEKIGANPPVLTETQPVPIQPKNKNSNKVPIIIFATLLLFICITVMVVSYIFGVMPSILAGQPTPTSVPVILNVYSLMGKSKDEIRGQFLPQGFEYGNKYKLFPLDQSDDFYKYFNGRWYDQELTTNDRYLDVYYDGSYIVDGLDIDVHTGNPPNLIYKLSDWLPVSQMFNLGINSPPDVIEKDAYGNPTRNIWVNHDGYRIEMNTYNSYPEYILAVWVIRLNH